MTFQGFTPYFFSSAQNDNLTMIKIENNFEVPRLATEGKELVLYVNENQAANLNLSSLETIEVSSSIAESFPNLPAI